MAFHLFFGQHFAIFLFLLRKSRYNIYIYNNYGVMDVGSENRLKHETVHAIREDLREQS